MSKKVSGPKQIPLDPPFLKGGVFQIGYIPLFEKEGLGEISKYGNFRRIRP
jgi:hypothetical protein